MWEEEKREREREKVESSSLKCVGECELVSRESPLSVARGVPPSVILSARPYFVAHAHAPSLACTHAAVHACLRARTHGSSRISVPPITHGAGPTAQISRVFWPVKVSHTADGHISRFTCLFPVRTLICFTIGELQACVLMSMFFWKKKAIMALLLKSHAAVRSFVIIQITYYDIK